MVNGKELLDWLYKIAVDKLLHFIVGLIIAQVSYVLLRIGLDKWIAALAALSIMTACSGIKEIIDRYIGVPSWKDFWVTVFGGLIGLLIIIWL